MNEPFDPYYTWLGIPPHEQPANFYRLLGIQLFEPNQRVIDNAADRQMMLLRSFQNGPNSGESQHLLNEVSAARGWLLDPQKKAGYDHQLGQLIASRTAVPQHPPLPLPPPLPVPSIAHNNSPPSPPPSPVAAQTPNVPSRPTSSRPYRPVSSRPVPRDEGGSIRHIVQIVVGGIAGLAIAVLLLNYFVGTDMLGWSARSRKQAEVTEAPTAPQSPKPGKSRPAQQFASRPVREADSPVASLPDNRFPKTTENKSDETTKEQSKATKDRTEDDLNTLPDSPGSNPKQTQETPPSANTPIKSADEIGDALAAAKSKHAESVESAKAGLKKAIEALFKKITMDGKLDAVKVLSAANAFETDETIPNLPELMPDVTVYHEARRVAAGTLHKAYQDAVKNYTSKLLVTEASETDAEMKEFIELEKAAISDNPKPVAKAPLKTKTTKDLLAEFYTRYREGMDKVNDQDITAKKELTHSQVARKLDDSIKSQKWTLHCRIRDVQNDVNGGVEIFLEAPEESPSFQEEWVYRTSVSNSKLSKEQALNARVGDALVITGNPRFSFDGKDNSTAVYRRSVVYLANNQVVHAIHLTNFKFSISKAKKDAADKED